MKRRFNTLPWRLGRTSGQEALGLLLFFWAGLSPLGLAESIPPPTIEHLVEADFIAVGRFDESQDGAIVFVTRDVLKGSPSTAKAFVQSDRPSVRKSRNGGRLEFWSMALYAQTVMTRGGGAPIDPTKDLLWFFSEDFDRGVDCQPPELTIGYQALLNGEEPNQLFRLLQELDPDIRREALELLVARKDKRVIEDLHRIALNEHSPAALIAVVQLDRSGLLEATRFWGSWNRHPAAWLLSEALVHANAAVFLGELMEVIEAEEHPPRVSDLLYELGRLYPREVYVETMITYLDHPAEVVRRRAVGQLWDTFRKLGAERKRSSDAQVEFDELSRRVVPLLTERLRTEEDKGVRMSMTRLLEQKDALPIAKEELTWSADQELKFLLQRLTSSGLPWVQATAGRELVQHQFRAPTNPSGQVRRVLFSRRSAHPLHRRC